MSKSQTINIDEIFEILFQPAWLPCDVVREHIAAIVLGFSDFNQRILQDGGSSYTAMNYHKVGRCAGFKLA